MHAHHALHSHFTTLQCIHLISPGVTQPTHTPSQRLSIFVLVMVYCDRCRSKSFFFMSTVGLIKGKKRERGPKRARESFIQKSSTSENLYILSWNSPGVVRRQSSWSSWRELACSAAHLELHHSVKKVEKNDAVPTKSAPTHPNNTGTHPTSPPYIYTKLVRMVVPLEACFRPL